MSIQIKKKDGPQPPRLVMAGPEDLGLVSADYVLDYFSFLLYGYPGTGKTRLMGQIRDIEELCPALWLDPEKGTRTIARTSKEKIAVKPVYKLQDVLDVIAWLQRHPGHYKSIVIDGLTSLYNRLMLERLNDPARTGFYDKFVPSQQDYQLVTFRVRQIIWQITAEPINFFATARLRFTDDIETLMASGGEVSKMPQMAAPAVAGQLALELAGEFDYAGQLGTRAFMQKVERYLQLEPYSKKVAKARAEEGEELPAMIKDPTMRKLYDAISHRAPLEGEGPQEMDDVFQTKTE